MTGVGGDELLGSVVSAADVAARLAALGERFDEFALREVSRENAPAYFETGVDRALSGWRGDAGALVTDTDGRVLLIRHAEAPETWGTPGGGHEPGESFAETARRELREETGVDPALTGVREAVRTEVRHEDDVERTFTMLTVHFEGVVGAAEPELDVGDDEILDARWFETPPDALHDHCEAWVRETLGEGADDADGTDSPAAGDAAVNERFVDARIESLEARFGAFPVRTERMRADDEFAEWVANARADGRVGGAYALLSRTPEAAPAVSASMPEGGDYGGERALLAMARGEDEWTVPGGGVDPGESFREAVEREVREETGVECTPTDVLAADRGVGVHEDSGREVHFLYVVFDATYDGGTLDVQASELNGACWFRNPPEPRHRLVEDRLAGWFDALDAGETDVARSTETGDDA